jgi:hypothetical protein
MMSRSCDWFFLCVIRGAGNLCAFLHLFSVVTDQQNSGSMGYVGLELKRLRLIEIILHCCDDSSRRGSALISRFVLMLQAPSIGYEHRVGWAISIRQPLG